jgi:hypothetical protein
MPALRAREGFFTAFQYVQNLLSLFKPSRRDSWSDEGKLVGPALTGTAISLSSEADCQQ